MSDKVMLPFEATDAMADAVKNIVSAYAAKKIWEQMAMVALFDAEAAPVQPTEPLRPKTYSQGMIDAIKLCRKVRYSDSSLIQPDSEEANKWFDAACERVEAAISAHVENPLPSESAQAPLQPMEPVAWFWFDPEDGGEWKHVADYAEDAAAYGTQAVPLCRCAHPSVQPTEPTSDVTAIDDRWQRGEK